MRQLLSDVTEFHLLAGQPVRATPEVPDDDSTPYLESAGRLLERAEGRLRMHHGERALRARLIVEEAREVLEALAACDEVALADGLTDLAYVTVGAGVQLGIPLAPCWDEVQRSNLAKFPTCGRCGGDLASGVEEPCLDCEGRGRVRILDAHGKVQKPEGWEPPDILGCFAVAEAAQVERAETTGADPAKVLREVSWGMLWAEVEWRRGVIP